MKPGSRTYNTNRRCGADTNVTRSENQWKAVNTVSYIHRRRWLCFSWGSGGDLPPPLLLFFHSAAACSTRHRHFLQRVNWLSHQLHLTSPRTRRSLNQIPAVLLTCRLSSTSPYNGVEKRHQLYQSVVKRPTLSELSPFGAILHSLGDPTLNHSTFRRLIDCDTQSVKSPRLAQSNLKSIFNIIHYILPS